METGPFVTLEKEFFHRYHPLPSVRDYISIKRMGRVYKDIPLYSKLGVLI